MNREELEAQIVSQIEYAESLEGRVGDALSQAAATFGACGAPELLAAIREVVREELAAAGVRVKPQGADPPCQHQVS